VLGLLGWSRCIRYRRLIRAPELLALALGWYNVFLVMIDWDHGWVQLSDLTINANGFSRTRNAERYRHWLGSWAAVGLFSGAILAIGHIRRRIPVGLLPLLLVFGWHGLGRMLPDYLQEIPTAAKYRVMLDWSAKILGWIFLYLPLAATLVAILRRPAPGWPSSTWLALTVALATVGASIAELLTNSITSRLNPWYLPSRQWLWVYPYLAVPPIVLLLEILLLAWAPRIRRNPAEPPA
jgi:hypothetical protein